MVWLFFFFFTVSICQSIIVNCIQKIADVQDILIQHIRLPLFLQKSSEFLYHTTKFRVGVIPVIGQFFIH